MGGGLAVINENERCFNCHSAQIGPYVFQHEALREGCTSCHAVHGSVNQKLLKERNATSASSATSSGKWRRGES